MAIFKLKTFARFARTEQIADTSLLDAINRASRGLVEADLAGWLIKQRVARAGQGKSGGYRVITGFRDRDFAVFLFGFSKSRLANLDDHQLLMLRRIFTAWLAADAKAIAAAVEQGELVEVKQ